MRRIAQYKVTTIFGYSLFALIVISFLVSTVIPFGTLLFVAKAGHLNTILIIIAFTIAVILPALVSYLLGDRSTHAKNKTLHHYNGILFGIAAYWLAQLLMTLGASSNVSELPYPVFLFILNVLPVILTIIVMAIVAVTYTKNQKNKPSVLEHRPYQVVLLASVIGYIVYLLMNQTYDMEFIITSVSPLAVSIVLTAISYKILNINQKSRLARLTDAVTAMSMAWITVLATFPLVPIQVTSGELTSLVSYLAGLVVFVAYLYFRTRKP